MLAGVSDDSKPQWHWYAFATAALAVAAFLLKRIAQQRRPLRQRARLLCAPPPSAPPSPTGGSGDPASAEQSTGDATTRGTPTATREPQITAFSFRSDRRPLLQPPGWDGAEGVTDDDHDSDFDSADEDDEIPLRYTPEPPYVEPPPIDIAIGARVLFREHPCSRERRRGTIVAHTHTQELRSEIFRENTATQVIHLRIRQDDGTLFNDIWDNWIIRNDDDQDPETPIVETDSEWCDRMETRRAQPSAFDDEWNDDALAAIDATERAHLGVPPASPPSSPPPTEAAEEGATTGGNAQSRNGASAHDSDADRADSSKRPRHSEAPAGAEHSGAPLPQLPASRTPTPAAADGEAPGSSNGTNTHVGDDGNDDQLLPDLTRDVISIGSRPTDLRRRTASVSALSITERTTILTMMYGVFSGQTVAVRRYTHAVLRLMMLRPDADPPEVLQNIQATATRESVKNHARDAERGTPVSVRSAELGCSRRHDGRADFLVAYEVAGGRVIAAALAQRVSRPDDVRARIYIMTFLAVARDMRGEGFGAAVFDAIIDAADDAEADVVILSTEPRRRHPHTGRNMFWEQVTRDAPRRPAEWVTNTSELARALRCTGALPPDMWLPWRLGGSNAGLPTAAILPAPSRAPRPGDEERAGSSSSGPPHPYDAHNDAANSAATDDVEVVIIDGVSRPTESARAKRPAEPVATAPEPAPAATAPAAASASQLLPDLCSDTQHHPRMPNFQYRIARLNRLSVSERTDIISMLDKSIHDLYPNRSDQYDHAVMRLLVADPHNDSKPLLDAIDDDAARNDVRNYARDDSFGDPVRVGSLALPNIYTAYVVNDGRVEAAALLQRVVDSPPALRFDTILFFAVNRRFMEENLDQALFDMIFEWSSDRGLINLSIPPRGQSTDFWRRVASMRDVPVAYASCLSSLGRALRHAPPLPRIAFLPWRPRSPHYLAAILRPCNLAATSVHPTLPTAPPPPDPPPSPPPATDDADADADAGPHDPAPPTAAPAPPPSRSLFGSILGRVFGTPRAEPAVTAPASDAPATTPAHHAPAAAEPPVVPLHDLPSGAPLPSAAHDATPALASDAMSVTQTDSECGDGHHHHPSSHRFHPLHYHAHQSLISAGTQPRHPAPPVPLFVPNQPPYPQHQHHRPHHHHHHPHPHHLHQHLQHQHHPHHQPYQRPFHPHLLPPQPSPQSLLQPHLAPPPSLAPHPTYSSHHRPHAPPYGLPPPFSPHTPHPLRGPTHPPLDSPPPAPPFGPGRPPPPPPLPPASGLNPHAPAFSPTTSHITAAAPAAAPAADCFASTHPSSASSAADSAANAAANVAAAAAPAAAAPAAAPAAAAPSAASTSALDAAAAASPSAAPLPTGGIAASSSATDAPPSLKALGKRPRSDTWVPTPSRAAIDSLLRDALLDSPSAPSAAPPSAADTPGPDPASSVSGASSPAPSALDLVPIAPPTTGTPGAALASTGFSSLSELINVTAGSAAAPAAAPLTLGSPSAAIAPSQPGLVVAPPPLHQRILPSRPPNEHVGRRLGWCAIPLGPKGNPIITSQPGAFAEYCQGRPNNNFGQVYYSSQGGYDAAVAHILAHFANTERPTPPSTLCLNCFLHHLPAACASPSYDWTSMVGRSHPSCPRCGQIHHVGQRCPSLPPPPPPGAVE